MYRANLTTLTLFLVLTVGSLMSESLQASDAYSDPCQRLLDCLDWLDVERYFIEYERGDEAAGTIKDLYEYLLQREYAAPVSYADHQIKRKAVRSPSLRLRFGRRSDPSMPVRPDDEDELIEQKVIRAPQLRLRFGRNDPLWTSFNENALLDENFEKRAPSQRLRWGRSNLFGNLVNQQDDVMQQKAIRAPQLRLRFGRTDPAWAMYNEHQLAGDQLASLTNEASEKRAPTQRLRWGRSDPALAKDSTEDNKALAVEESETNAADDK